MTLEVSIRDLIVPSEAGTRKKVTSASQPCEGSSDMVCLRDCHRQGSRRMLNPEDRAVRTPKWGI